MAHAFHPARSGLYGPRCGPLLLAPAEVPPLPLLLLLRRDHHHHQTALHARKLLDDRIINDIGGDLVNHRTPQFLVSHLATAEADRDLDLVAFLKEPAEIAQLDRVIADIRRRTELQLLDFLLFLLLLGRMRLLLRIELELAEIHDSADRRVTVRLDFDQIQACLLGHGQSLVARQNADLLSLCSNDANTRNTDFVVPAVRLAVDGDMRILLEKRLPDAADQFRPLSDFKRSAKPGIGIDPKSSPARVRTETAPDSFSRSPTTSR